MICISINRDTQPLQLLIRTVKLDFILSEDKVFLVSFTFKLINDHHNLNVGSNVL